MLEGRAKELEVYSMNLHSEVDNIAAMKKSEIAKKTVEIESYKIQSENFFKELDSLKKEMSNFATILALFSEALNIKQIEQTSSSGKNTGRNTLDNLSILHSKVP